MSARVFLLILVIGYLTEVVPLDLPLAESQDASRLSMRRFLAKRAPDLSGSESKPEAKPELAIDSESEEEDENNGKITLITI